MQPTRRANIEQYRMIAKANSQLIKGHDTDSGEEGGIDLIFAGYVPLASQSPYPISVYSVANRPIRLNQCCTQFKPFGNKTFCFRNFHII